MSATLQTITEAQFALDVLKSSKPVLVDFWAPWCGPCKMLAPVVEKVATKLSDRLHVVSLNTDEAPNIAAEYQISGIPCLMLFKNGLSVDRLTGFTNEAAIIAMVEKNL
jgi:thioredoxin 1